MQLLPEASFWWLWSGMHHISQPIFYGINCVIHRNVFSFFFPSKCVLSVVPEHHGSGSKLIKSYVICCSYKPTVFYNWRCSRLLKNSQHVQIFSVRLAPVTGDFRVDKVWSRKMRVLFLASCKSNKEYFFKCPQSDSFCSPSMLGGRI